MLKLAVGARVMLTVNVNVADGLVNGARGEVVRVITNNNEVSTELVKFDSDQVGVATIHTGLYRNSFPNAVPVHKHEVVSLPTRDKDLRSLECNSHLHRPGLQQSTKCKA